MSMKEDNVQISCADVIRICDQTLAGIQTRRDADVEKWIQSYMKKDRRGFWAQLFRNPPIYVTRAEAEKALHTPFKGEYWHLAPYESIQSSYQELEALAKRIKKLAYFSMTGYVNITAKTIDRLVQ